MEAQYYQLDQLVAQIQRWRAGKPTPSNRPAPTLHRFPHQKASNIVQHQTLKSNGFAPNLSNLQAKRKRPNPPQPQVLSTTSPLPVSPATSSRKDTPSPTNSPHVKTEEFSGDRVTVRVIHSHPEKVLISGHLTTVEELFPESQNALFNLDISDEYVADLDLFNCCPLLTSHSVLDRLMLHNFTTEERKNVEDADYPDFVITETNLIRN